MMESAHAVHNAFINIVLQRSAHLPIMFRVEIVSAVPYILLSCLIIFELQKFDC